MSEPTVYAIASGKGGVGKTTTAINLGAMLADRDHSVVVVDTDLGMANLADFLDFEVETPTLHEVLAGEADFEDAVYRAPGDIDVLPSATDIEAFTRSDPGNLQDVVAPLREEYDYVLLDTGAGVSYDTLVPLALADAVLLVATPDVASVRDTAKTGELAERVESEVAGAVLTQRSSDILNADDVEETLGTDVLAVVPQDEAVPMGIDAGRPLAAFAPNAPAGQAYRDLAAVVTGEADPDPELDLGGDADVEFDAEPPRPADEPQRQVEDPQQEDAMAGGEVGGNARDAVGNRGESGGLLGGELANAAEEIRDQVADQSASSPGGQSSDSADGRDVEASPVDGEAPGPGPADGDASEPTDGDGTDSDPTDESEPRSVDDLIEEHIGDDRLGGGDPLDDDPLGGGDPAGDDSTSGDDSPAGVADDSSDVDEVAGASDGPGGEAADGASHGSDDGSDDGLDPDSIPFEGESEPPSAGELDEDAAASSDSGVGPANVGPAGAEPAGAESNRVEPEDAEASDPDGVKTGTLADEDDDGILGRIGSLFK